MSISSFKNFLAESISSDDKGVLHELLVGRELNRIKNPDIKDEDLHMSGAAKDRHDLIKSRITPEEYENATKLAKGTAKTLHNHFKGDIESVHWTSKPGDIGRLTGHDESQQENPADLMVKHKDVTHTGISLKITQKKGGKVPVGNPGAKQTDQQLGRTSTQHYEDARGALTKQFPQLSGKSKAEQKTIIKSDPKIKDAATKLSNTAIGKIRDEWHDSLSKMSPQGLSDHIRNNLLHAHKTRTPLFKVTTGGVGDDHTVSIEHPETSHNDILNNPEHIKVEKSGNNSINFTFKGKTFLKHRIKPESTPLATSLKGSAE